MQQVYPPLQEDPNPHKASFGEIHNANLSLRRFPCPALVLLARLLEGGVSVHCLPQPSRSAEPKRLCLRNACRMKKDNSK